MSHPYSYKSVVY